ncbi:MAG: FixH family protein [Gammaproteobacteria bacterium]|nr:FixH family protein [Gammaproteobacteria bacterium]
MLQVNYKKFIGLLFIAVSMIIMQGCNDELVSDPAVSLTDSYSVKYASDMSMISAGKSTFTLEINDINTGDPVSGLSVSVMPMMYMASGYTHDTPVGAVVDNGDGTYEATVYYLMASEMMDGTVMGEWELRVMIGGMAGETAIFNPDVMMPMGDTFKAHLKGQADMIMGMNMVTGEMEMQNRTYIVFKNHLMGSTDNHTFSFFIAARESMMSHVAVYEGVTLNQGETYEYLVSPITAEVSTDATNWTTAMVSVDGNYMVSGLTGLTDDQAGEIYVRLTIQGEQKTTNGLAEAGDGSNDYGIFSVTPGTVMSM